MTTATEMRAARLRLAAMCDGHVLTRHASWPRDKRVSSHACERCGVLPADLVAQMRGAA